MIVIVSNGKQYSDHRLYFVEAPDMASVEAALHPIDPYDPEERLNLDAVVLGEAPSLRWTQPPGECRYQTMTLRAFADEALEFGL